MKLSLEQQRVMDRLKETPTQYQSARQLATSASTIVSLVNKGLLEVGSFRVRVKQ